MYKISLEPGGPVASLFFGNQLCTNDGDIIYMLP